MLAYIKHCGIIKSIMNKKLLCPKSDNEYTMYVPKEILEMAMKIEDYFIENKINRWVIANICSRNHMDDITPLREKLHQIEKILK